MAKKQTAKERREAQWKKTLDNRLKKSKKEDTYDKISTIVQIDITEEKEEKAKLEELEEKIENAEFFEIPNYDLLIKAFPSIKEVKKTKNKLMKSKEQVAAERIEEQEVLPLTDVILDENMQEERQAVIEKMQTLLKRRFSLTSIADALQTNNYEILDNAISQREEIREKILEFNSTMDSNSDDRIRMFSRFKYKVGKENSIIYVEQENRMKVLLEYIRTGEYLEKAKKRLPDAICDYIEPAEEYNALKAEMQKWKAGKLTKEQREELVANIVNFSIGCKEFYSGILMRDEDSEEEPYFSSSTLAISSQIVELSNDIIEKHDESYDSSDKGKVYEEVLAMFDNEICEVENTILRAEIQNSYEDVVADILDNTSFNAACRIETAYYSYELDRIAKALDSLEERYELADTVEKCRELSSVIKTREEAYTTIEELVAGKSRPTLKVDIKDENEGR